MNVVDASTIRTGVICLLFIFICLASSGVWAYVCPTGGLDVHSVRGATPFGNASAGVYMSRGELSLVECVRLCCAAVDPTSICHTVFHYDGRCLLVQCTSQRLCDPLVRSGEKFQNYYVVNVRAAPDDGDDDPIDAITYLSSLGLANERDDLFGQYMDFPLSSERLGLRERSSAARELQSPVRSPSKLCDLRAAAGECPEDEECVPKSNRAREGVCVCTNDNFIRDPINKRCIRTPVGIILNSADEAAAAAAAAIQTSQSSMSSKVDANVTLTATAVSPSTPTPGEASGVTTSTTLRHLVVSAGDSKEIRLPENSGTLSAFAVVGEGAQPYRYEWSLVAHPPGDDVGIVRDKNAPTVKFSGLKEGVYRFKVTVSNEVAFGEAYVNVTVLPPERVNKPPVAAVNPVNQTVKLPNTDVVLDGSASTDDDGIYSYAWEVVTAPIEYSIGSLLTNTATLQLKNLVPGFYTFMLTVTDTDGAKNSTYANVVVIKETDYPPTANAGPDVIVYLPRTDVTLNGSLSTDDKGIKSWEWTKGAALKNSDSEGGGEKAVDMQDTRTPILHLSNLELGMYTFVLRVTDTADQSSTAEVHVFVKAGKEGPFANAGPDQAISLPINSVVLDGSKSHDDIGINRWEWKQVSGPSQCVLTDADKEEAVASKLRKGVYVFQLTVFDDKGSSSTNTTVVTVLQSKNEPPKANAGGDLTVELPRNLITLNGSVSNDDIGIVSYVWSRDPSSLAVGEIVEGSDQQPLLMLTGLLPGRYLFKLTVTDSEGLSDSDTASLIVRPSSGEKDDVEMKIASDVLSFSEEQKITLSRKLALLLQDDTETNVIVTRVSMERNTRRVFLVFHAERDVSPTNRGVIQRGPSVVQALRRRLRMDASLLGVPVLSIETVVCQNNCSGHGSCDPYTKRCVCEAFWMEDVFRAQFMGGDGESNCDWSILYVIIVLVVALVVLVLLSWSLVCICNRKPSSSSRLPRLAPRSRRFRRRHRYTLLDERTASDNGNIGVVVPLAGKKNLRNGGDSVMLSDSDLSESETVFDKLKPSSGDYEETTVIGGGFGAVGRSSPPASRKLRTEQTRTTTTLTTSPTELFVSASE